MHRLLQRQLKRYIGSTDLPQEWQAFLSAIDAAYQQTDDDRALLERSLELTSQELLDRNEQLRQRREELEKMVQERTAELEYRTIQLQTAAEVARDATTVRNLDELLNRTVVLVRERFGFYHTAIYLADDRNRFALLMAATGKAGQQMLAGEFKHKLDESNLVGRVIQTGEAYLNLEMDDTTEGPSTPLLPETQSELILPLRVADKVIGVLDAHSREANAFNPEIRSVLQILADQLATAISNTRQLTETEQTLRQLEIATGQYTKEAWHDVSQRNKGAQGYRYRGVGVEPLGDTDYENSSEPALEPHGTQLSVPIRLREQIIGNLSLHVERDEMLPETTTLAESVAERMALALESARLLEDSQRRAEQERLIARITTRMRESLEVDRVLGTAIQEISQAFGDAAIEIQLDPDTIHDS